MQSKKILYLFITLAISNYIIYPNIIAQEDSLAYDISSTLDVNYNIFDYDSPLEITLIFNVKQYQKSTKEDKYIPSIMKIHNINPDNDIIDTIRVRPRGNNRAEICSWPPIRINISKSNINNVHLENVKNVKLVTHCNNFIKNGEYVLKEYLIYKIYELISPYSFKVRLAEIKYIDTGRKNKETTAWAFLIEPEKMMAERINMVPVKLDNLGMGYTDTVTTNMMAIFQYMIGNADYSITGRHNVKLLKSLEINRPNPIPVPYDFDYAGLVDASYAIPGHTLGIEKVTDRYFLGPCREEADYVEVYANFTQKKEAIYDLINNFEYLHNGARKKMTTYLDEFFDQPAPHRYIKNAMLSTCRDPE